MNNEVIKTYVAMCTITMTKMKKEQYDQLRYCESKMKTERCSSCVFSARLQALG